MTRSRRSAKWIAAVTAGLTLALLAPSCSRGDDQLTARESRKIESLETDVVPTTILDLNVTREDVAGALEQFRATYVDAAALYSFRSDELVQATLQIAEFAPDERYQTEEFRRTVVDQVGSSAPRPTVMGKRTVYRTTGTKQAVAVWFEGRTMYLLAIRDSFGKPRTLIRTIVDRTK